MSEKNKYERSLENELGFFARIQKLGFESEEISEEEGWTKNVFSYRKELGNLKIDLALRTHPNLGINISLKSSPFDKRYHFVTSRPISEKEAFYHIKEYVEILLLN